MTAADLLTDEDFLSACKVWERNGRAPFWFADWLRERGIEGQADAWEWAANEPDRPGDDTGGYPGSVRPYWSPSVEAWWWVSSRAGWYNHLPFAELDSPRYATFPEAIVYLLDRWAAVHAPAG